MTKPHEEAWTDDLGDLSNGTFPFFEMGSCHDGKAAHQARVRLAVQAPSMARLLLDIQWAGRAGPAGDVDGGCPASQRERPEEHAPDCAIATVLRAAGVIE